MKFNNLSNKMANQIKTKLKTIKHNKTQHNLKIKKQNITQHKKKS